ncbi:MAG TPA: hypothetical protein VNR61_03590 [Niallia sp.]|nr:hypothetical protein [Niallia sp.]
MILVYGLLIAEFLLILMIPPTLTSTVENNELIGLIIILVNCIGVFTVLFFTFKNDKNIFILFISSFCIRIFLLFWDLYSKSIFVLPGSGRDSEMFHGVGLSYPNISFDENPYGFFVGLIYYFTLDQRIVAQYVNLLFSMSTIIISLKIMEDLNISYKIRLLMLIIISFIPNYLISSILLLRESIMIFLLAASLYCFIKWWKENNLFNFLISIVLVLFASVFHSGVISNAAVYILVFLLMNNKERKINFNIKTLVALTIFTTSLMILMNSNSNIFLSKFGNVEDINDITRRTSLAEEGGSAYQVGGEVNSFSDLLINSPIRIFYFIVSPLPWDWRGLNDIIAFLFSALFYFITYIYSIKALNLTTRVENKSLIIVGLLLAFFGAFIFAWGVSNAGTAIRHRDKFIVNYLILLAISLDAIKKNGIKISHRNKNVKG